MNTESILKFKDEMYKTKYKDIPVFDCHTHIINSMSDIDKLDVLKKMFGFEWMNVLSITAMGDMAQNLKCVLFKRLYPEKNYIFGGLLHSKDVLEEGYDYEKQVRNLISLGFDGMKMIEGKPDVRKKLGKALDDPSFDGYYRYLEAERIPVLFHVADPEEFWDRNTVPDWAYNNGWFYGDGTYRAKEDLYSEVNGILTKFPKLHAIFAHFFFLSGDLKRTAEFLDRWENVSIDLTPGTEMYVNFSKNPNEWREFFIKYQDRILFGTDVCDPANEEELGNMIKTVRITRMFLETNEEYKVWDLKLKGICLDREVLEKIYYRNFFKYVKAEPKKLDLKAAIDECRHTIEFALRSSLENKTVEEMKEILNILNAGMK